jgi:hypothetical protein
MSEYIKRAHEALFDADKAGEKIAWAVYHRGVADEYAERKVTDEQWDEIFDRFDYECSDLWEALAEVFATCVSEVINEEEEE